MRVKLCQYLAALHELGLVRVDGDDGTGDLRRQAHHVAVDVGIVGFDLIPFEDEIVDSNAGDDGQGTYHGDRACASGLARLGFVLRRLLVLPGLAVLRVVLPRIFLLAHGGFTLSGGRRCGSVGRGLWGADRLQGWIAVCVPPAAAQSSEQHSDIGESLRIGLHLGERGLLVLLLGDQHLQFGVPSGAKLVFRQLAAGTGGVERP
ncbi:MAG TPA: hypothetical protein VHY82_13100, partial [Acetobacteraceae bacterium]|nr:hypothetical protein [Acetobacteraceae bacterium]